MKLAERLTHEELNQLKELGERLDRLEHGNRREKLEIRLEELHRYGYAPHADPVHRQVAKESKCDDCGHVGMRFIGRITRHEAYGGWSFIAIAHCLECGYWVEL